MIALWIVLGVIGGVLAFSILDALFIVLVSLPIKKKEYDKNSRFYRNLIYFNTFLAKKVLRIKVKFIGKEKLKDVDGRFLLVSNHISCYDPIITWQCMRKYDVAFISKGENFNVPIFGKIIRKMCFMAIDRENPRNAIKAINHAADLINKDEVSVGVYPEGTRSKSGELLTFHDGVFKIAQKANVPVVVSVIKGTNDIHKNYIRRKTRVEYQILDVISTEKIKEMSSHDISELAYNEMKNALN